METDINYRLWLLGICLAFFVPYLTPISNWERLSANVPPGTVEILHTYYAEDGSDIYHTITTVVRTTDNTTFLYSTGIYVPGEGNWQRVEGDDGKTAPKWKGWLRMFNPFVMKRPPEKIIDFSYATGQFDYAFHAVLADGTLWAWSGARAWAWVCLVIGVINTLLFILLTLIMKRSMIYVIARYNFLPNLAIHLKMSMLNIFLVTMSLFITTFPLRVLLSKILS